MKTGLLVSLASVCLAASALAQQTQSQSSEPSGADRDEVAGMLRRDDPDAREREPLSSEPGSVVVLRGLDKVTARTRDFEIEIGETEQFGALAITAQYCRKRPPEETPETYAFLQIRDRRTDGFGVDVEGEQIFSGWMFASRPAQNPLEHAVYDVWVLDCRA
ncbi:DUF2155 domain-containing protein [Maricaulis sp.]|uniref:DUF2155 domain-containing protein n=1 Tax=Maricaulis sp. TaxID=1486257 RepID=UPI0026296C8D|nr:DUF2155 domain-containing protein [Maricaulis sp.]